MLVNCTNYYHHFDVNTKNKNSIDGNAIFGEWKIDRASEKKSEFDECVFTKDFYYACYSHPKKNSYSDIVLDYKGKFVIAEEKLNLYLARDEILNLDERLLNKYEIIDLDNNSLVLKSEENYLRYKRVR